jgi:hypothetical protein
MPLLVAWVGAIGQWAPLNHLLASPFHQTHQTPQVSKRAKANELSPTPPSSGSSSFLIVLANLTPSSSNLLTAPHPCPGLPCIARPPKTGVWFASLTTTPFSCGLHAFVPSLSEWRRSQHLGPPGIGPLAPERGDRQVKRSTGHAGINAQEAILPEVSCCFTEHVPSL